MRAAGEGPEFPGEPLIREESMEVELPGEIVSTGKQGDAEEEQSHSTEKQTQELGVNCIPESQQT